MFLNLLFLYSALMKRIVLCYICKIVLINIIYLELMTRYIRERSSGANILPFAA